MPPRKNLTGVELLRQELRELRGAAEANATQPIPRAPTKTALARLGGRSAVDAVKAASDRQRATVRADKAISAAMVDLLAAAEDRMAADLERLRKLDG